MIQAIIMCAGKSTRTYPLTLTRPKPLLRAANKTILEHNLEQLEGLADEIILIVGHEKNQIKNFLAEKKLNHKIRLAEQKEQLGTGHAVLQARDLIKDRFVVLNGDDFYFRKDMVSCLRHQYSVLAQKVSDPERFGVFVAEEGIVKKIVEKPKQFVSNLANTGLYVFEREIFPILKNLRKSERGEYEITDVINALTKDKKVYCIETNDWMPIGYPWDLLEANKYFLEKMESDIQGVVEPGVTIKGNVVIGEGSLVKSGTYIEGPVYIGKNCQIGPNCYIRAATSIGDNSKIGNAVEIKNSIIGNNVKISHLSYLGDSILGDDINIGAGTVVANIRHDYGEIKTPINGELVNTKRKKLGAIIGDGVKLGIKTSIYPGRKIWPGLITLPGEIVSKDKTKT